MVQLYGIPNCDQIRKTKTFLINQQIAFEFVNIRRFPLSETKLHEIIESLGMDLVINRRGKTYHRLAIKDLLLNDDQLFRMLADDQTLIKRPLLEINGTYLIGYDEANIMHFLLPKN